MKDFYLTLISSSSMEIYAKNKACSFTVQLPREIILNENWVVGLSELQYSYNFFNVSEDNNSFTFDFGERSDERFVKIGFYNSVSEIINAVLEASQQLGQWIEFDSATNRTKLKFTDEIKTLCEKNYSKSIQFHGRLALQLGFLPDTNVLKYDISPFVGNVYFGIPDQMFIYCDLVEPQLIGYESSQIVKVINTTEKEVKFGSSCFRGFQKVHYIPVMRKEFDKVEIEIRDITGEYFPFRHGVSTVKLHFKENKIQQNNGL